MRPLLPRVLAALLLLPLAATAGAAQEPQPALEAGPLAGPLEPEGGPARVPVLVRVPCAWVAEGPATVRFHAPEVQGTRASWLRANVTPALARTPAEGCAPGESDAAVRATLEVVATRHALALTPTVLRLGATVEAGADRTRELATELTVEAAYVGDVEVKVDTSKTVSRPQSTATFLVTLVNHGNQNTRVALSVEENPGFLGVLVPSSIILGVEGAPGAASHVAVVPVHVQTPYRNGHLDETNRFVLRIHGGHTLEPALEGDVETLALEVRTVGTYVPAPPAPLLLAMLGLAAALARRR